MKLRAPADTGFDDDVDVRPVCRRDTDNRGECAIHGGADARRDEGANE